MRMGAITLTSRSHAPYPILSSLFWASHMCICTFEKTYAYMYIHIYIYVCILYTCIHINMHVHMHIHV